ncbi:MAG: MFS transporter [Anaerolineae bacterium]|nr:MFS transporter [Anaerolineae bacterium]
MQTHRNIRLMYWINFFTDFRLYSPVAALYFTQVSGSLALGMSVFSVGMLSAAIFEVPTALVSDLIGRRMTLILGAIASLSALVLYALGGTYLVLIAGAVVEGLARAFWSGNNDALIYDSLALNGRQGEYAHTLGRTSAMYQIALASSALLGGLVATRSFTLTLWLSSAAQAACLLVALFLTELPRQAAREATAYSHLRDALQIFRMNPRLRLLSLSSILAFGLGETAHQFNVAFFATLWPIWAIGLARALANGMATIGFAFAGRVIRRFGALRVLLADDAYNRVAGIIATAFPTPASPALISAGSLFFGLSMIAQNDLLQREFSNAQRATMASLNALGGSLFFAVIAVITGVLGDRLDPGRALLVIQALLLSTALLHWRLFRSAH